MKRVIIVAIAMVIAAFGLRTNNGETKPTIPTIPTTTVVVDYSFGAHDVLQEELNDPAAFAG